MTCIELFIGNSHPHTAYSRMPIFACSSCAIRVVSLNPVLHYTRFEIVNWQVLHALLLRCFMHLDFCRADWRGAVMWFCCTLTCVAGLFCRSLGHLGLPGACTVISVAIKKSLE